MDNRSRILPVAIVGILAVATILLGTFGWWQDGCPDIDCTVTTRILIDAIYRSLLAFGGDTIYIGVETVSLLTTRFLGMLTTISAVFAILGAFAAKALIRRNIRKRKNHIVLIGADAFSLSYAEESARIDRQSSKGRGQLSLLEVPDRLKRLSPNIRNSRTRMISVNMSDTQSYLVDLGTKPARIILGEADAHINVERAAKLVDAGIDPSIITLRLDDDALGRSMHLWSPATAKCQWISESGLTARSLFCDVDFSELARIRSQKRVHLAIIGLGSTGFSVAEEAAQRLHHPQLERTRISAIDKDASEVDWEIKQDYPGLRRAIDFYGPVPLDALHLGPDMLDDELTPILEAARDVPLTAIIIAAADDSCSARIAMRLRSAQEEERLLLAPIFVRMRMSGTIGPERVTNLSEGVVVFGGTSVHQRDVALDNLERELGQKMHEAWRKLIRTNRPWDDIPFAETSADVQRSNLRAGLGAVDMLRYAGLVPPRDDPHDQLRIQNDAAQRIENDKDLQKELEEAEHNRWSAERFCAGWIQADDGIRDDAKRRHTAMVPWESLSEDEQKKDLSNVFAIVRAARHAHSENRRRPVWRQRIRIGITGPLKLKPDDHRVIKDSARDILKSAIPGPASSFALEIICPNAPGFDRVMACALLNEWQNMQEEPAELLLAESRTPAKLDLDAIPLWLGGKVPEDEALRTSYREAEVLLRQQFNEQTDKLIAAANGQVQRFDNSLGRSGQPTDEDRINDLLRIFEVSDFVITGRRRGRFGRVTGAAVDQIDQSKLLICELKES